MEKSKVSTAEMSSMLNQHRLAVAVKFSVIAIAVIALYFQDLSMVFTGAITDEATFHILAVPALFAFLLYRKRKMISAAFVSPRTGARGFRKYFSTLIGILLCTVAILTYWYGSYSFTPLEYHMATLPFFAAGLILILFNLETLKQALVPVGFLIFLMPPPDAILYGAGSFLANLSASASTAVSNLLNLHAVLSSSYGSPLITITRPDGSTLPFSVSVACSGIYSIIGFVIFALFIAYIMRGTWRSKFAILIMGIPLIMALNVVRITTILTVGYYYGEDLALQVFHAIGSTVLMFIGTLLLLLVTEKFFQKPKSLPPCPACSPTNLDPSVPFCANCGRLFKFPKIKLGRADVAKISGIVLVTIMLLTIQAPVFALTKGPAQVLIQTPSGQRATTSTSILPNIPGYSLSYIYEDTAFEQMSGDDAALVYAYVPSNATAQSVSNSSAQLQTVWVAIQIASSPVSEHRWETCLYTFPLSQGEPVQVTQLDLRDIQLQANPPMTARYFAFQYKAENQTEAVLYWYETATFVSNGTTQTKSVMMSLVMYPSSAAGVSEAENQELPMATAINNYWAPVKTWSTVAIVISKNALTFSGVAVIVFILLILYALFLSRQERLSLLNLYKKLPTQDRLLIEAVNNAKNVKNSTVRTISVEFQKLSSAPVSEPWLAQRLEEEENTGILKKTLISKDDNPAYLWKSQISTAKTHKFLF